MYKKTFTYDDFEGNSVTEDLYFNLTRAEMLRFVAEYVDSSDIDQQDDPSLGVQKFIQKLQDENNISETIKFIERVVTAAYGVRDEDGKHFRKNASILDDFTSSAAYEEFIYRMLTNNEEASVFVAKVFPTLTEEEQRRAEEIQKSLATPSA